MRAYKIDILIKKYLDAETTLAEESILRDYFNNNNVEEHLLPYKMMFAHFNIKETYTKPIVKKSFGWIRIAASIVLLIGMYFGFETKQQYEMEIAYNETKEAFNLLGTNLNKGTKGLTYIGEFNKTTNKIFKK